jgi:hypothetical protein
MDKTISRRELFTLFSGGSGDKNKSPNLPDPYFERYANKALPSFAGARTSTTLSPFTGPLTEDMSLHLLRRLTFGVSKASLDTLNTMTNVSDAVNFLLYNAQYPATTPVNNYQPEFTDTQGCPFGDSWVYFPGVENYDNTLNFYRTEYSFKPWWFGLMINQPTHVLEKLTLFWANHFGARTNEFNDPKAIWKHYDTIRSNALGNFRTLIKAITIDPHMLRFLNGYLNTASAPDENYARELQELFTVGKGPASLYTEDDVKQAARVLTGWRRQQLTDGSFATYFDGEQHDTGNKQFSAFYGNKIITGRSGQDGQYETDDLLDMILSTDEAAKYLCRCLYRWFVYYVIEDAEEQNIIAPLAQIMRSNNYEITPVLSALFNSEHFFDQANRGCVIKSPIDLYVSMIREFAVTIPDAPLDTRYKYWKHFKVKCDETGQKLADPTDVSGWPAYRQQPVFYEAWINSNTIQKRARSLNYYSNNGNQLEDYSLTYIKIDSIAYAQQFPNPADPGALIAGFVKMLLPLPVSDLQLSNMKSILLANPDVAHTPDYYWSNAWYAYSTNPTDMQAELTVRQRLNGLVDYITRLEEYQLC